MISSIRTDNRTKLVLMNISENINLNAFKDNDREKYSFEQKKLQIFQFLN